MEMQLHPLKVQIYERSFQITFTQHGSSFDVQEHPTEQIEAAEIKTTGKTMGIIGARINLFI